MKKNILISVYDMQIGGIERSLINMLESFNYDKYNVDLLIFDHVGEFMGLIPDNVHILPSERKYSVFRKSIVQCIKEGHVTVALIRLICKFAARIKYSRKKLQEGTGYHQMQLVLKYATRFLPEQPKKYDLAISYAWPHDITAKKVHADKKMAWIHTDYSKLEIDNQLDLEIWNQFDYIGSVSEACTEAFVTRYPTLKNKIVHIENITSPQFIQKMADEESTVFANAEGAFNIVSVGRLSYVKGFDMAVQALRKLHDKGFDAIKWYVVGYGGYEAELKQLIAANNLADSFILLGKKTNPYPYIRACDLYVQPSRYEGKAVTVTEAKILGRPILITNYPTAHSQIEDGIEGFTCDLSVEGIAAGIEQLYRDHRLRDTLSGNLKSRDYSNRDELDKLYRILLDAKRLREVV